MSFIAISGSLLDNHVNIILNALLSPRPPRQSLKKNSHVSATLGFSLYAKENSVKISASSAVLQPDTLKLQSSILEPDVLYNGAPLVVSTLLLIRYYY